MPTNVDPESKKKHLPPQHETDVTEETVETDATVVEATAAPEATESTENLEATETADTAEATDTTEAPDERKKVHIEFPYSDLVRAKAPKVFEVAENVAEEWVNDGNFENVPVGHPLAQITVAAGLRKAKEVEKKLEEKGVFAMAKMGLEYAKSKINKK